MDIDTILRTASPWALIIVSMVSLLGNGTILMTVAKNPVLRQKDCLYLIAALAVADFLTAAGTIPYSINTLMNDYANCSIGSVFWSVAGNVSGVRMNQICTLFLSIDRLYAFFRPFAYRTKNHLKIAQSVIAISVVWGAFDIAMNTVGRDMDQVKSSCTMASSYGDLFKIYRLYSNLVLNALTQVIYLGVFYKLRRMKRDQTSKEARDNFAQANATLSWLFLTSLLLMTIPSIFSVYVSISKSPIGKTASPVLTFLAVLNGAFNVFIYGWKHREFNKAIRGVFGQKTTSVSDITEPHIFLITKLRNPFSSRLVAA